ncbi:MAG: hypothetical protein ACFFCS_20315 [Candidatus Hodarchaeota archaeon]
MCRETITDGENKTFGGLCLDCFRKLKAEKREERRKQARKSQKSGKISDTGKFKKYVLVAEFDVSDFSDYERDEDRLGEYYIKNAMHFPIEEDDFEYLQKTGDLESELRKRKPGEYMKALRLTYNKGAEGVFINFITEEGIEYLKKKGYHVKIE